MRRLWPRTRQEQIDYHLRRNDTPEFDKEQPGRVDLARFLIDKIIRKDLPGRELTIVELGCGAGDITGPYASVHGVHGYDVVPRAAEKYASRWPSATFHLGPVEDAEPIDCDILVMCEFLEHVDDPWSIVRAWMPRAHFAIIGHPLDEPDPPYETGHIWSYALDDWEAWFSESNFHVWERFLFPMGYWKNMVMGHGSRKDLPPYVEGAG